MQFGFFDIFIFIISGLIGIPAGIIALVFSYKQRNQFKTERHFRIIRNLMVISIIFQALLIAARFID